MSLQLQNEAARAGFSAATAIPALASTIKQVQREAAESLHVLASYAACERRAEQLRIAGMSLGEVERNAARHVGRVLVEQAINGSVFLLAVKVALVLGVWGGAAAQVAITANTIVNPHQTQRFNPARGLLSAIDLQGDWVNLLSAAAQRRFAYQIGLLALSCGYGAEAPTDGETVGPGLAVEAVLCQPGRTAVPVIYVAPGRARAVR